MMIQLTRVALITAVVVGAMAAPGKAQTEAHPMPPDENATKAPRKSPHDRASMVLAGKTVTIDYGRPYLHGRQAVGGSLVPFGEVWRLGADEASKLTTPVDVKIGNLTVPAGSYALFTIATKTGWTLIVNKTADQWGAFTYDAGQDLGRTPMKVMTLGSPVEQFTIDLRKKSERSAALVLSWEKTSASVEITAK